MVKYTLKIKRISKKGKKEQDIVINGKIVNVGKRCMAKRIDLEKEPK